MDLWVTVCAWVMGRCMGLKAKSEMVLGRGDTLDKMGVSGLMVDCG